MLTYEITSGPQMTGLIQVRRATAAPVGKEVQVRMRAVALNYRDLMIAEGSYLSTGEKPVIPCSDGAGEVVAVGAQVTRFRVGDRVVTSFFPDWIDGRPTPSNTKATLGADRDGVLARLATACCC
jgi:NADPH:quinone reductase-like Zn-dependent oxidoreductase